MSKLTDYPGVSSYQDRHGTTRWRHYHKGKFTNLPGHPGEPAFEAKWREISSSQTATEIVTKLPSAFEPVTFKHAWLMIQMTSDYRDDLDAATKEHHAYRAALFL